MIFFCLKKWFFNLWDNLYQVFILNIISSLFLSIPIALYYFIGNIHPFIHLSIVIIGFFPFGFYLATASRFLRDISDNQKLDYKLTFSYIKEGLKAAFILMAFNFLAALFLYFAIPFYNIQTSNLGMIGFVVSFGFALFLILLNQYVLALHIRYEPKMFKAIRKSLKFTLDNPGFSLGMLLVSIIILVISTVTLTFFPGITGLLLWHQVCFKMRMLKYEYLDKKPHKRGEPIPWQELLKDENEKIGKRSLRGLIFPWKE